MKSLFIISLMLLARQIIPGNPAFINLTDNPAFINLTGNPAFIDPTANPAFIDPTGTYVLTGSIKKNRIRGHSGELRVRLLEGHNVAVCFYINKGYPGYESGAFMDTLRYEDNKISWFPSKDTSCEVAFYFDATLVEILEIYSDPHSGCGFGRDVLVPAIFQKSSNEIPIIQDLSARGTTS